MTTTKTYRSIRLNNADLRLLDEGWGLMPKFAAPGDEVYLAGYVGDNANSDAFDLCINGTTHDNFIEWINVPQVIRERLESAEV